jgi:large subunit ribosomal protein L30
MASKLKVRQIKSAIGRQEKQKRTLRALGIRRMHQTVVVEDNPCMRGMVKKIEHLLEVEELNE